MALNMSQIRAKILEKEKSATQGNQSTFNNEPNAFLAHWLIPEGQPLNLRFLPDGNSSNEYFWKERDLINLTFNGIKGGDPKTCRVSVPCNEMWEPVNSCPVLREVREWYKTNDDALKELAQKYWKKKTYLFQCFIAPGSCEVKDDVAPENPIRRVILNKNLFNKVKSLLMNPKIEYLPVDYAHGRDFGVIKNMNGGGFAEYDNSTWDMFERALDEVELKAIEQFGLYDLEEFMPKKPSAAELQAIAEMFEASVNGEAYDPARWAEFYRPQGVQRPNSNTSVPTTQAEQVVQQVQQVQQTVPTQTAPAPAASPNALSALAALTKVQSAPAAATAQTAPVQHAKTSSTSDLLAELARRNAQ